MPISVVLTMLLVGAVSVLAGCSDAGPRVAVLGDSITSLDAEALQSSLGGDYRFAISGNFGRTATQVAPEAEELAKRSFSQVIINLGTNDVLQGHSAQEAVDAIARYVDMFDSARCVHLVTVNEHMVNQRTGAFTGDLAAQFNERLRAYADSVDRVDVIDWNAVAAQNLNDAEPPTSTLTEDSIHPTPQGNQALNDLYAGALGDCTGIL